MQNKPLTTTSPRWHLTALLSIALHWKNQKIAQKRAWGECSPWWSFIFEWNTSIHLWLNAFIEGRYQFSPLKIYHFSDESVTLWNCSDRLILSLIHKIIKPTFSKILSPTCYSSQGISGVQSALNATLKALKARNFRYIIRIDIKSYYASIQHSILLEQLNNSFDDPRLRQYLNDIVTIAVDNNAALTLPTQGIPRRSSMSPFFGALYLTPLDRVFEKSKKTFYARYMDDVLVLCETRNQFVKAKKRLKKMLVTLKLKLSPHKTKMGAFKTFHFLGVNFASARTEAHTNPLTTAISIHPRSCRRALDKLTAMREDAVHPAEAQRYLSYWAKWWNRATKSVLPVDHMLTHWVDKAIYLKNPLAWLGRGLLLSPLSSYDRVVLK